MKKTVKSLVAVATALVLGSAAFAETSLSFYDKVYSDLVNWGKITVKDGNVTATEKSDAEFTGIYNEVKAEFKSDRVDAAVKLTAGFDADDAGITFPEFTVNDYYIEFRPVSFLTLGFSDVINTTGSYLPVADDNAATANIGSDIVLVVRPIAGLRIAAGFDLPSTSDAFDLNFGADYANSTFAVGVALRNPINSLSFEAAAALFAVDGLTLNLSFAHDEAGKAGLVIGGKNVLGLGATFVTLDDALTLKLDFETNFGEEGKFDGTYTMVPYLYAGINPEYQITSALDAGLTFTVAASKAKDSPFDYTEAVFGINPYVDYTIGNHHFGIGFVAAIGSLTAKNNGNKARSVSISKFGIPVYYKYAF